MEKGRVHSGLTRVVWELNAVGASDGGTKFISGSHKAAFSRPNGTEKDSPLLSTHLLLPIFCRNARGVIMTL